MTHKKKNKTKVNKPTKSKAHSLNQARSKKQSNTTSTDDNSTTPPTDDNNNSAPTDDNSKKSNRGCLGFKKPRWFQWRLFPKDDVPPIQSFLEIAVYSLVLCFCYKLYLDFNKITNNYISIEAEKLNDCRYAFRSVKHDSTLYLQYVIGDFNLHLPMQGLKNSSINEKKEGHFFGSIKNDSLHFSYTLDEKGNPIIKDNIAPYWNKIYDEVSKNPHNVIEEKNYKKLKSLIAKDPELKSVDMRDFSRFKISMKIMNGKPIKVDTTWQVSKEKETPFTTVFIDKTKRNVFEYDIFKAEKTGFETIGNQQCLYRELYQSSSLSEQLYDKYTKYYHEYKDRNLKREDFAVEVPFYFSISTKSKLKKLLSIEPAGIMDRYDFSQGWYTINLNSATIDSIHLTINFIGATEFLPMKIQPDEIGSNYIKYTDQKKIQQIKKEGLKFYAKFKELENIQTIRCFCVTAIISGLLLIVLTFIILGVYRSSNVIGKFIKNRR